MKKVLTEKKSVLTIGFPQQVNHSQRARDTPLRVWFLAEKCGTVIAAHCDCVAGLCEGCSHVGAVLFAVEAGVRIRDSTTCTQGSAIHAQRVTFKPFLLLQHHLVTKVRKGHGAIANKIWKAAH